MTYQITRPLMTATELAEHQAEQRGRDYRESDDGYSDMEAEQRRGWRAIANWGADGWNLGAWPYVMIYTRDTASCQSCGANLADGSGDGTGGHWQNCTAPAGRFALMQIVEGDRTAYAFTSEADRDAALDFLFLWYAAGQRWAPLAEGDRAKLDAGELTVDAMFRGPYRSES